MSSKIKIALIQIAPYPLDTEKTYQKTEKLIQKASEKGAKIVCTPELLSIGYPKRIFDKEKSRKQAISRIREASESVEGPFVHRFKRLARKHKISIILGLSERKGQHLFNSSVLITPTGKIIGKYSKVHVCRFSKFEDIYTDGTGFRVFNLNVGKNTLKVGIMICYDREHPESARILALKDADIIFVPNACNIEKKRIMQLQTRALENEVYIAMANYSKTFNGNSVIIDYNGDMISKLGNKEGIILGKVDIKKLHNFRKNSLWGKHYRRPKKYKQIIA